MAAGKINLQANDGKVLGLYAPDGMGVNTDIVPANVNGDATKAFKVADAVNADEALAKGQLLTEMKLVDGSGSGLDADLVRGLPADFTASKATNGYQKLPSGLILQWGKTSTTAIPISSNGGTYTITLPITFPTAFLTAVVSSNSRSGYNVSTGVGGAENTYNTSQFTVVTEPGSTNGVNWIAIGY